ncbi:MAG: 3-isopropylmalate dehydratase small subunit [Acidimicrobiia bacterium]|nr:3-isopropylmalate dehydratase small subunit [Acidimicrobiia bacterium]
MKSVSTISGTMVALLVNNLDTDQIIPKNFLKRVERSGFGPFLFHEWAYDEEGEAKPDFILNHPDYQEARVLVTGENFGSGSSREHAPWAISDWGFEAVIAPSFADIFRNNCYKNALLPIELSPDEVAALGAMATADHGTIVTIELEEQTVTTDGFVAHFAIDPFVKHCLQNGLDDIALTLAHGEEVAAFEASRPSFKPSLESAQDRK